VIPTIISASRRTDIPAFYPEWFMNRIRAGYAAWVNPFGGRRQGISLAPEDVAAIVFWSKNFAPLVPHLDELDRRGYRLAFQFTITGLPSVFEPGVPEAPGMIDVARALARRYGADAVLWRYDPILISELTSPQWHIHRFRELTEALEGATRRCYFNFPTMYAKVARNLERLRRETAVVWHDVPTAERINLAQRLAGIAGEHCIEMHSCCGDYLVGGLIKKASCIDGDLLRRLYPDKVPPVEGQPSRKECGCYESRDIGAYDTCPHGCVYCYANANKEAAAKRWADHDSARDSLRPLEPR
jgi:hypothetical protein